ncbi:AraC family transcriptional regulator [Variovorax sp. YR216]|uniref:AraC family transcriptional regulator n=1 Tax=Variovorax sp. YR216 TaxID=1882828 RepID=UPI000895ADC8|nr:AraC family transcriptional regulator [Variovorax sp. YR216]SEB25188.1 transcriptional regulator, AraC family [Variovorax sp. YR216]
MRRIDVLELREGLPRGARQLTRGATLTGYEILARSVGLDPSRMLQTADLPLQVLADPDTLVGMDSVAALLEESARQSNQEAFGLLLAETQRLSNLGVLATVVREEPTLRAALEALGRYMCLQNAGLRLTLDPMGEFTMAFLELELGRPECARQAIEMSAAIVLRTLRALAPQGFNPVSICFRHGPPHSLEIHKRVLGPAIDFAHPFNAIVCRSRELGTQIASADPEVGAALKRRLDMQLTVSRNEPLERVRHAIRMLLPSGDCSVDRVAEQLGTHRRTLNRQLAATGDSVSMVIDDVRAELAETYLTGGMRTLYQVGHLLGFASGAAFSRWFRDRFGMTASQWMARREASASTIALVA